MDSIEFLVALTDTGKILYSNIRWINTNPCLVDWQEMSLLSPYNLWCVSCSCGWSGPQWCPKKKAIEEWNKRAPLQVL